MKKKKMLISGWLLFWLIDWLCLLKKNQEKKKGRSYIPVVEKILVWRIETKIEGIVKKNFVESKE